MTDHANHTAASNAGWVRTQLDRGSGKSPRYVSRYEKPLVGQAGESGFLAQIEGHSDTSQGTADTNALAALNGFRAIRYGSGSNVNLGSTGSALTVDAS